MELHLEKNEHPHQLNTEYPSDDIYVLCFTYFSLRNRDKGITLMLAFCLHRMLCCSTL